MIYYKIPVHLQNGYAKYFDEEYNLVVSEKISKKILSIPMHPYLNEVEQDRVLNFLEQLI